MDSWVVVKFIALKTCLLFRRPKQTQFNDMKCNKSREDSSTKVNDMIVRWIELSTLLHKLLDTHVFKINLWVEPCIRQIFAKIQEDTIECSSITLLICNLYIFDGTVRDRSSTNFCRNIFLERVQAHHTWTWDPKFRHFLSYVFNFHHNNHV